MGDTHGHLILPTSNILFIFLAWMSAPLPLKQHSPLITTSASRKMAKQIYKMSLQPVVESLQLKEEHLG